MVSKPELREALCAILGTENVYFQPPASVLMRYPCIRYSLDAPDLKRANNRIYKNTKKYEVVVIDYEPDSPIPDAILERFQYVSIDRRYTADNLNHTVLTLYY